MFNPFSVSVSSLHKRNPETGFLLILHRSPGIFQTPTISVPKLQLWRRSNYPLFCTFRRPATMFLYFPGICSVRPSIFQFSFVAPILLQRRQLPSQLPPKSNTFSYNFLYCFKMYLCNPFFSVVAHHKTAILFIIKKEIFR